MECASEQEAFFREMAAIDALRKAGVVLCNQTIGGEGGQTSSSENLSEKGKARFSKDGAKERHSKIMKQVALTAEFKSAVSKTTTLALRGEARERHLAGLELANAKQSSEDRSNAQLRSFEERPERYEIHSAAAKLLQQNMSQETRESRSSKLTSANLNSWADPEIRAKRIAGMRGKKHTRKCSKGA
jgi:hypothetical protein